MKDIKTIVKGIARLKPIPQALHQIMALARQPEVDMTRLAETISRDPVLTANLLKDANSAYYGRPGRFETVHQAVVFLGMEEVVNLLLMTGCRERLKPAQQGYDLEAGELWRYSLTSAMLARAVAIKTRLADPQLVFTAAMLKDIGKVVLSQYVAEQYRQIRQLVDAEGYSFREAESLVLGIDHAQLGAMVAQVWCFSPKLVDMIACHHQPLQCQSALREAAAVHVGDLLCMMRGTGVGADGLAYRFHPAVFELLALSEMEIQMLLIDFDEQADRFTGLMDSGAPSASGSL